MKLRETDRQTRRQINNKRRLSLIKEIFRDS